MAGKIRLQFDVDEQTLTEIDALKDRIGAESRARLLRNALRLYATATLKREKGYRLIFKKGKEEQTVLLEL